MVSALTNKLVQSCIEAARLQLEAAGEDDIASVLKFATPELADKGVWDNDETFYPLQLYVPSIIYKKIAGNVKKANSRISSLMRSLMPVVGDERLGDITILPDSRQELSLSGISSDDTETIWGQSKHRIFISHVTSHKDIASKLKKQLGVFGCSAFVAHEDIEPTEAWQDQIEVALRTMDALVALLSSDFHNSKWTDQEIGFACARGVKVIPVMIGAVPYGFIGKIQGLKVKSSESLLFWDIYKRLPSFSSEEDAFVSAVGNVKSYDDTVVLASLFSKLKRISEAGILKILAFAMNNNYVRDSNTFWYNTRHSYGFHYYIREWLGYDYVWDHIYNKYVRHD